MIFANVLGKSLYQWELGRLFAAPAPKNGTVSRIEFCHKGTKPEALMPKEDNGLVIAPIPNYLLQESDPIYVYLVYVDENQLETITHYVLSVTPRPKPADYVYTETEVLTWEALDERLKKLEGQEVDPDVVANAVEAYMAEHPIEETDPTVPAWAKSAEKPTYTAQEVGALPADTKIPTALIVTPVDGVASHTPAEIYAHVQSGGVVYYQAGNNRYWLSSCTETNCNFISVFQNTVVLVILNESGKIYPVATQLAKAEDIPTTLPNPHALTFTGAVSATYDGSGAVGVEIPAAVTDTHINSLIDDKLGVIENGSY